MLMKTNIEKWNYYSSIIKDKTDSFIKSQLDGLNIPDFYYVVHSIGKISKRTIEYVNYNHSKQNGKINFSGKKPTKKDIIKIIEYANSEISFSIDNIYFVYSEPSMFDPTHVHKSTIKLVDLINKTDLYYSLEEAELVSFKILESKKEYDEFLEENKKDSNYNYESNDYKFLGWMNSWVIESYDEDNNLCSESGKKCMKKQYPKEKYTEYRKCINSNHLLIKVNVNKRKNEHIISCPRCKIYWKCDSSD